MSAFPRLIRIALLGALVLGLGAAPAWAEKGGNKPAQAGKEQSGKPDKGDKGNSGQSAGRAEAVLVPGATATVVYSLLGGQRDVFAVGAKPLPPGIRKNLARGKPLPPGIARQSVPPSLLATLPVVDGSQWLRVGTELVLVGAASQIISQVIQNVFD